MMTPYQPANEESRLKELKDLKILDTASEERFDRIVRVAKSLFKVPMVAIGFVDTNREWFKASCGLNMKESARDTSFCGHAILEESVLVVPNALQDVRFADNPLVTGPLQIRFYAGVVIYGPQGHKVGTLCIKDTVARELTAQEKQDLIDLGKWVELEINSLALNAALESSKLFAQRLQSMNSMMVDRELKMVALKKEVLELKEQIKANAQKGESHA